MKTILTHYVVMERYLVPDNIADLEKHEIEKYIQDKELLPYCTDSRDFEVVDIIEET